ncbi:MAG: hypothetical protein JSV05_07655 [Candidatus Bathyarchaeota archaeon]|nr:MAG: hypothetical protein JSV05_07655 [Candidatus Bathyarchaeota archaeon]
MINKSSRFQDNKRIFLTDCEGPLSKNDNAFELTSFFLPKGEKIFAQISKYDDVLADIIKRADYKAGDTLKLIVPFLKAYEVTNCKMIKFARKSILLMPGARETMRFLKKTMPSFIVSTSFEQYIKVVCNQLDFPYENTYCTALNIDAFSVNNEEKRVVIRSAQEISEMPLIEIPKNAESISDFSIKDQHTIERLDEIFWDEISQLDLGRMLREINPIGGKEKADAARNIVRNIGSDLSKVFYVGDSITDAECFRLIRNSGGITISFNGNEYAVREAESAVLSVNSIIIAALADVFRRHGGKRVHDLINSWSYGNFKHYGVNSLLSEKIHRAFPKALPKAINVNINNIHDLVLESNAFRKGVRGEKIGSLG